MHIVLVALNAKYIHQNLAVRLLRDMPGADCTIYESNINAPREKHYAALLNAPERALVGFSAYIWNVGEVVWLCAALKKARPDLTLLLGGPECSGDPRELLRASRADYAISGEGEKGFREFVALFQERIANSSKISDKHAMNDGMDELERVPGLWYREGGEWRRNPEAETPMEQLPFPYENERLDGRIAYYESSRGCPFRCAFCMSAGVSLRAHPIERVLKEIGRIVSLGAKQVKLLDRTFNFDPVRARAIWAALIEGYGKTKLNFHFEIAAHLLTDTDFFVLAKAPDGLFQFEIGVQSTNAATLKAIERGGDTERIFTAIRRLMALGNIHIHVDLIACLPHESLERFGQSFDETFALRPDALQFGFLKLLPGSRLRERAVELGVEYDDAPPYAALKTDALSASEVVLLGQTEQAFSRVWNGRFDRTAAYLLKRFPSPFALFSALGRNWRNVGNNPQDALFMLHEFAKEVGILSPELLECMKFDFLRFEKRSSLPGFLPEMEAKIAGIAKGALEQAVLAVCPELPKPYGRFARLERFEYDVLGGGYGGPIWLLFVYAPQRGVFNVDLLGKRLGSLV